MHRQPRVQSEQHLLLELAQKSSGLMPEHMIAVPHIAAHCGYGPTVGLETSKLPRSEK